MRMHPPLTTRPVAVLVRGSERLRTIIVPGRGRKRRDFIGTRTTIRPEERDTPVSTTLVLRRWWLGGGRNSGSAFLLFPPPP